jgi:7-cyano-7-deazaguanine reductase
VPGHRQPDYAISVAYRGQRIDRASLAACLGSYYSHPGFHEHCVERMFVDILHACLPLRLTVEAQFTRRGGIDISPLRTNTLGQPSDSPTLRQ